jgi:hypothetical protein
MLTMLTISAMLGAPCLNYDLNTRSGRSSAYPWQPPKRYRPAPGSQLERSRRRKGARRAKNRSN